MAVVRDIEPWDELLQAGRDDERLVMQSSAQPRPGKRARDPRGAAPEGRRRAASARHRAPVVPPGRGAPRRAGPGRRSSPPAPRPASRCASSSRRSTCSAATPAPARSTSTRPRRSRRTRRARCTRSASRPRAARDLRRRHAARAARGDPPQRPTSSSPTPTCCTSGSCPTTRAWANFFANLAVVVVDEAHVYRGVFGSHVANVLRRLRRIADAYGTAPRFLLAQRDDRQPGRAGRAADRASTTSP